MILVYAIIVKLLTGKPPRVFRNCTAQLLAFSTSSSAATLPVTMECVEKSGINKEVSSFVLPIGRP